MAPFFAQVLGRCRPPGTAFVASLLLSLIAIQGRLVNRDGIYILDTARAILEQGLVATLDDGDWNFFPLLVAALGAITPFGLENAAFLLNALLMAGAGAVMVRWVGERNPEAAWAAVLVVLTLPAFNLYRSDILREYGFWCFSLTGLWLALRWHETGRWRDLLGCQAALVLALLFRFEAVVFFIALALWQVFSSPPGRRLRGAVLLNLAPIAGLAGLMIALLVIGAPDHVGSRYLRYVESINPAAKLRQFAELAQLFSEHVLQTKTKYSSDEAVTILFFGLLSLIPIKFISGAGVLILPLAYLGTREHWREALVRWQPLPWAFLTYSIALAAFVTQELFLSARYVSFLHWLAVPLFACGLHLLWTRFPRGKPWFILILLVVAISNVVGISPKKSHIVDAGRWLRENGETGAKACVNNTQMAYYAGWRTRKVAVIGDPDQMFAEKDCRTVVIKVAARDLPGLRQNMQAKGYAEKAYFGGHGGDAVIIARRLP